MRPLSLLSRFRRERAAPEPSQSVDQAGGQQSARLSQFAPDPESLPDGTDWCWRPAILTQPLSPPDIPAPRPGHRLGDEIALWHDCAGNALGLRQSPASDPSAPLPFSLTMEAPGFTGSYLSLSIDLPPEALVDLTGAHVLRLELGLMVERAIQIYGRLNVRHGPNTDEILRKVDPSQPDQTARLIVEFDLAHIDLNAARLDKIWCDLILEDPAMNSVGISDLIMSRHMRANF